MKTKLLLGIVVSLCVFTAKYASAVSPTPDEMALSRQWAASHFDAGPELGSYMPFFSFTYDGKPNVELLKTWQFKKETRNIDENRTEYTLTHTDPKTGLVVRCVGIEYEDFPTVEWTLYFKNTSDKDTPILADIQAIDIPVDRPAGPSTPQTEFRLYHQKGAPATATDYQPFETLLTPELQTQLSSVGGRPCDKDFPYFNLQISGGQGMIVVVGWPGQWAAKLSRDKENHLRIRAGQELTHFKLLPGEEVRTPLIVLQFWKGNRLHAQNVWRRWMIAHNLPRPGGKLPPVQLAACSSHQFEEMYKANTESQKLFVDRYLEERIKLDYWWMDAGWYPCDPVGWWKTGTWEVDTRRFPKGLREISDYARAKDVKTIVWFEPERVYPGTWLADNHPEWILGGKKGGLLNLGNPDAWKWLTEHVNKLIDDQGIDLYRQDFNMAPLDYWRGADAQDRQGITENKHVVGYLAYWDDLIRRHPNMLIDTCASGGHRNDLETLRRSVPLLRSDYILEPVGNQGHTYGLAFWVPYFGTGGNVADPYVLRSVMLPGSNICFDVRRKDLNYDVIRREIGLWRQYAPNFLGDYYPLTPYSLDSSSWIGWQFDRPESGEGMIQAFRRAESPYESVHVKLQGLEPEAVYTLTNVDVAGATEASGRELMDKGIHLAIENQPGSAVIVYKKKAPSANASAPPADQPSIQWNSESGQAVLTNGRLEVVVETKSGVNARSLRDVKSGQIFADRDYAWSEGGFPKMDGAPVIADSKDGGRSIACKGRLGSIAVEQVFTLPKNDPGVILEQITIGNPTDKPLETAGFHCGFAKHLRDGETWSSDASDIHFCPVPYRRETNGQMQEFPLREVAEHGTAFAGWMEPAHPTPLWGAEGWAWSFHSPRPLGEGTSAFLLAKFNPAGMEWSLMEPLKRATETVLCFGGAGQWKYGHPEGSARLEPGKSYRFGETRLQAVDGDWKQAYYAYRGYVESKGCKTPNDYNPPVHWNELYDNEYFPKVCALVDEYFFKSNRYFCPEFIEKNNKLLKEYYSLDLMKGEAAKAKELGCEALYLDPGWDTGLSHQVWDDSRLGSMESFVKMMREEYGLKGVSLWCSLAGVPPTIGDPTACPIEARVLTKDGKKADLLVCFASPGFLDTKEKRLLEVCRNGAVFLMFDSDQYSGPCYDKTHGHQIPSTREDHAKALFELARRVKTKYPHVLIEMHDPITGPSGIHYTPSYFGYAPPHSFDCLWGHEFMWDPLGDLLSGRAVSLYYYNLAYSIPIYLHVSLKQENEHALVFWWYASTCRHLGVGGKPGPAAWEADKRAMQTYLPLKRFYIQGEFYGIEETVHAHTLPDLRESVLNIFNLTDKPMEKEVRFRLADIGLPAGSLQVEGAPFTVKGDEITMKISLPAHGHQLVKIKSS